jgi:N-acetylmuramoyl-L-alanine amidase
MTTYPRGIAAAALVALSLPLAHHALPPARSEPAAAPATKPSGPQCNPATFRMIVDVGHTAEKYGARSARGAVEYDFNLSLAKVIHKDLIDAGFSKAVLLITTEAPRAGLFQRVAKANAMPADLFLSIHHDSVPDPLLKKWEYEGEERSYNDQFKGHSIFASIHNGDYKGSLLFGKLLGNQMKARGLRYTPHYVEKFMGSRRRVLVDKDAGVYRYDELVVLKDTHMPAVLLEAGSIINRDEELELAKPERQGLISAAVTAAVKEFCTARAQRAKPPPPAAQPNATATTPKPKSKLPWPFNRQ